MIVLQALRNKQVQDCQSNVLVLQQPVPTSPRASSSRTLRVLTAYQDATIRLR